MAFSQGFSDASKAWSLASKYALWLGSSSERSAAMTLATAGMVLGLYHRCGFGVLSGSPRTCWATMTLRLEFGEADSMSFMKVS